MTQVVQLIQAVSPHIPFKNEAASEAFLSQYALDDQAAIISALYIGRDHINNNAIQEDYIPAGTRFDRFFSTGNAPRWIVDPSSFARVLFEKNTNVTGYFAAFMRCTQNSGIDLANF